MRGEAVQHLLLCGARLPRFKQTAACLGGSARVAQTSLQQCTTLRSLSSNSDLGRARTIYVQKVGKQAYSEPLMLGLVAHLRRMFPRVGFFKPIVGMDYQPLGTQHYPRLPVVMHHTFKMKSDPAKMFAMSEDAAFRMLQQKDQAGFLEACQNKLADYQQENDIVVVDGWRRGGLSINAALAKHIDAPLLLCTEYFHSDTPKRCLERAVTEIQEYRNSNCDVLGLATSGVPMEELEEVNALLTEHLANEGINYIVYVIHQASLPTASLLVPSEPLITNLSLCTNFQVAAGALPRMKDLEVRTLEQIYHSLKGKLLFDPNAQTEIAGTDTGAATSSWDGDLWEHSAAVQARMGEPVSDFHVVTTHHGPMLSDLMRLHRPLLVTSSDRVDYISSALAAHASGVSPLSGIAITQPESLGEADAKYARATIKTVYDGLMRHEKGRAGQSQVYQMPIFTTSMDTFQVVQAISSIEPALLPSSLSKIESSIHAFDEYINSTLLMKGFATTPSKVTPSRFVHNMRQRCIENPQRIVLPEAHDHRIIEAAGAAQSKGIANVVLLGDKETIQQEASTIGVSLEGVTFVDPHKDDEIALKYAQALVEARKKKALPLEAAKDHLKDFNYFATMMVRCGDADGMVSGAASTTAATIRPALQVLKDFSMPLISSVFFMCLPDKVLVYGDCAVNVEPDPKQLAYIAIASADTAAAFGLEPRVAMLSYSTLGSGSGPQVDKVSEATKIAQELRPELPIVGPIQYDAATNERIAATKVKEGDSGNRVAGKANVLIFPDLNTGNNTYKAVQQSTGALAMGPIMQGLGGAVNDLSRGCTVADALDTICVTSLQAMFKKEH